MNPEKLKRFKKTGLSLKALGKLSKTSPESVKRWLRDIPNQIWKDDWIEETVAEYEKYGKNKELYLIRERMMREKRKIYY